MKFSDGNWMMRPGVQVFSPSEAHDAEFANGVLTVWASTRPLRHRGDTLGGPLLTVRLSSPLPDVVRVQVAHFTGGQDAGPHFPLHFQDETPVCANRDDNFFTFTTGHLSARVPRKGWGLDFIAEGEGRVLTRSAARGLGCAQVAEEGMYLREQLALGVGECVYGLGERFTAFVKNGQSVDTWNRDGGTSSDQVYKSVPFYLTNRGYGVFVNHPNNVSYEVATERVSCVQFSVPGETLDYFVLYGPTPQEVLEKYTRLTGRPALPPAWSFGLWLTTSFTTSYDEETVTRFIDGMAERRLPLRVFHFDCFWMREFHWCDFQWDARVFPDPPAMLRRLHARGLKVCVWINPYIAQRSALFAEGVDNGYFLRRADGAVWQTDQWQPGMGIVDFSNPAACCWFQDNLRALLQMGVDCFKTDFGERIPTDVIFSDGSCPEGMHNFYAYLYNKTVFDLLREERGEGEAVLFARAATAGAQQFPVHWGGDCNSTFESMAESLRGGLSLCLSGFGFWSHDIGGFEGAPPASVYKRWIAFGLLSSHSRLHGSATYRVPWLFDEEAVDVLRFFTHLKCRLMPYLYAQAVQAHQTGTPVMRAMLLEFPEDPACATLDRQYLLGGALLVAPVFSEEGFVDYYVPEGRWTRFLTGETVCGPRWMRETHGFSSLPLLARPHSVIAVGSNSERPDYAYTDGVTFQVYELEDGGRAIETVVPALDGTPALTLTVSRSGQRVSACAEGRADSWRLLLANVADVLAVEDGTGEKTPQGLLVTPEPGATAISIVLP